MPRSFLIKKVEKVVTGFFPWRTETLTEGCCLQYQADVTTEEHYRECRARELEMSGSDGENEAHLDNNNIKRKTSSYQTHGIRILTPYHPSMTPPSLIVSSCCDRELGDLEEEDSQIKRYSNSSSPAHSLLSYHLDETIVPSPLGNQEHNHNQKRHDLEIKQERQVHHINYHYPQRNISKAFPTQPPLLTSSYANTQSSSTFDKYPNRLSPISSDSVLETAGKELFRKWHSEINRNDSRQSINACMDLGEDKKNIAFCHIPNTCCNVDQERFAEQEISSGISQAPQSLKPNPSQLVEIETVKRHQCEYCAKWFYRSSSLSNHRLIHRNTKSFKCGQCNMSFLRKSDLGKHSVTHSGSKPYQCKVCGKRFSQSSNMLTHQRRHTGIRPYSCSICGKAFYRKVDVRRHASVHRDY